MAQNKSYQGIQHNDEIELCSDGGLRNEVASFGMILSINHIKISKTMMRIHEEQIEKELSKDEMKQSDLPSSRNTQAHNIMDQYMDILYSKKFLSSETGARTSRSKNKSARSRMDRSKQNF